MFKLRPIWVGPAPSSACPAIFPLVNKSSSFLGGLLPEIGVNGALLSMVDEFEEGGLFRWNAILLTVGLSTITNPILVKCRLSSELSARLHTCLSFKPANYYQI